MTAPAGGAGLYIRIAHRFGPRQTEWMLAGITALWGLVLLAPGDTFDNSRVWDVLAVVMPEWTWGWLMLALGVLRLGGLIVNGARRNVTPWIRVATAMAGAVIWIGVSTGFALSMTWGVWLATYPAFALAEFVNIVRASRDAGQNDAIS